MTHKKTHREPPISYRPPKGERAEILRRAERAGLSVSGYITRCIFGHEPPRQSRRPSVEKALLVKLVARAGRLRDELHAIRDAGGGDDGTALMVERACDELAEIRAACFEALGRKP